MNGDEFYYLPRTSGEIDPIYKEDKGASFDLAIPIEMYIKTSEGYGGSGFLFSKFGIDVNQTMTFTVSRKRFLEIQSYKLQAETGNYTFELEGTDGSYILPETVPFVGTLTKPRAGDLIYSPVLDRLFEIKYVDPFASFYQLGKLYTYDLQCDVFEYSHQRFNTGIPEIDSIEEEQSANTDAYTLLTEDEFDFLTEDGFYIIDEAYRLEETEPASQNEEFSNTAIDFIDWNDRQPHIPTGTFEW